MTKGRRKRRATRLNGRPGAAWKVAGVIALALVVLAAAYYGNNPPRSPSARASEDSSYPYQVGRPGPGEAAPSFRLPSASGETFDLAAARGTTVLLFFHEGAMCQSCFEQIRDIEARWQDFQALGIDRMVSISTDSLDVLRQIARVEGLSTPLLSDEDLSVSRAYTTNLYGHMGGSRNGHSFILVGPDGRILWRADYGGAPRYIMYVPVDHLLTQLGRALGGAR